jgi:spore coat polysaccharide biosynthesis predicted glycosyltransferase SpsG
LLILDTLQKSRANGKINLLLSPEHNEFWNKNKNAYNLLNLEVHQNVPSVYELVIQSDLIIGSYGNLTYEALALGVPFVSIGLKSFQVEYSKLLASKGFIYFLGDVESVNEPKIEHMLAILNKEKRSSMVNAGYSSVDGQGLFRIVEVMNRMLQ